MTCGAASSSSAARAMAAACQPINQPANELINQAMNHSTVCIIGTHQRKQTSALLSGITG
jgi:hypothetical protein